MSLKGYRRVSDNRLRRDVYVEDPRHVQRLFSMFPPGWPGIGLLLLRSSVATALVSEAYCPWAGLPAWIHLLALLLCLGLLAGYLTPLATTIGLLLHILIWSKVGVGNAGLGVAILLSIVALALIGPGQYSLDAYRFGRRVVVLPPR